MGDRRIRCPALWKNTKDTVPGHFLGLLGIVTGGGVEDEGWEVVNLILFGW